MGSLEEDTFADLCFQNVRIFVIRESFEN